MTTTFGGGEPDALRLGDEIADGEHQPVLADDYAASRPLGAERRGGEGVLGNLRLKRHDGREGAIEVEAEILGTRPIGRRRFPSELLDHRPFPIGGNSRRRILPSRREGGNFGCRARSLAAAAYGFFDFSLIVSPSTANSP